MGLIWLSLVALPPVGGLFHGSVSGRPYYEPIGLETEDDEPPELGDTREAELTGWHPDGVFCPGRRWTMSGRKVIDKEHPPFSQKPWIVIRGATFRSREAHAVQAQEQALCSLSRHVIEPLKRAYALSSVRVHLCVRPHQGNEQIMENAEKYFRVARGDVSLREVSREEQSSQQGQYQTCFEDVPNDAGFALVLRPDLVFKEDLDFTRAMSPNMFYFQWNLFQMCMNHEVADQIHLVGGNLIKEFKEKWDSAKMGAPNDRRGYYDTFHMMYNWAEKHSDRSAWIF